MLTTDFVVNGSAMDLLTSIAQNIKNDVERFYNEKHEDGTYESFKELDPFSQRIEFFRDSTDYKTYRSALRNWILFGEIPLYGCEWNLTDYDKRINLIKEGAAKRSSEVYALRWEREPRWAGTWEETNVRTIVELRIALLEQNPILSDPNIDIYDRRRMMNLALRGNKQYQNCQKEFDNMVKKAVSSLISAYLLEREEHPWSNEYSRVVEKA